MNWNTYLAARSVSAKAIRRSSSPRCRTPASACIVLFTEGGEPAASRLTYREALDLRRFLQQMLHGVARLGLPEEECDLPLVQRELCREPDSQLLVAGVEHPDGREEVGARGGLRDVQGRGQFLC